MSNKSYRNQEPLGVRVLPDRLRALVSTFSLDFSVWGMAVYNMGPQAAKDVSILFKPLATCLFCLLEGEANYQLLEGEVFLFVGFWSAGPAAACRLCRSLRGPLRGPLSPPPGRNTVAVWTVTVGVRDGNCSHTLTHTSGSQSQVTGHRVLRTTQRPRHRPTSHLKTEKHPSRRDRTPGFGLFQQVQDSHTMRTCKGTDAHIWLMASKARCACAAQTPILRRPRSRSPQHQHQCPTAS